MKKEIYKAPLKQIVATNPIFVKTNKEASIIVKYDRKITDIGEVNLYRNFFNVLVTLEGKNPIFLDNEIDDMIQDFFLRTHKDTHTINYADTTNMIYIGEQELPKRRILKRR